MRLTMKENDAASARMTSSGVTSRTGPFRVAGRSETAAEIYGSTIIDLQAIFAVLIQYFATVESLRPMTRLLSVFCNIAR